MYIDGYTPDAYWKYEYRHAPSSRDIADWISEQQKASTTTTTDSAVAATAATDSTEAATDSTATATAAIASTAETSPLKLVREQPYSAHYIESCAVPLIMYDKL